LAGPFSFFTLRKTDAWRRGIFVGQLILNPKSRLNQMVIALNKDIFQMGDDPQFLRSRSASLIDANTAFATFSQKLIASKDGGFIIIEGIGEMGQDNIQRPGFGLSLYMEKFKGVSEEIPIFSGLSAVGIAQPFRFRITLPVGSYAPEGERWNYVEFQLSGEAPLITPFYTTHFRPDTTDDNNIWTFALRYYVPEGDWYDIRVTRIITEYKEIGS
jgi:hypothetical protein